MGIAGSGLINWNQQFHGNATKPSLAKSQRGLSMKERYVCPRLR